MDRAIPVGGTGGWCLEGIGLHYCSVEGSPSVTQFHRRWLANLPRCLNCLAPGLVDRPAPDNAPFTCRAQLHSAHERCSDFTTLGDPSFRRWAEFAAGFTVGGEAGVAWAYVCTQILPYYS